MSYSVKEILFTLQGEGHHTGRPAVLLRFSGCNLWSGLASDRAAGPGSCSAWCDTDFVGTRGPGGGRFATPGALATAVRATWPAGTAGRPFVVCTGGEPLLQLDDKLVEALHGEGFEVAVETNGTLSPPAGIDWTCVSPKAGSKLVLRAGDELKLIYPQEGAEPHEFEGLEFTHYFLQPLDGPRRRENTAAALRYCLEHPSWRLSLQTQKILGIP